MTMKVARPRAATALPPWTVAAQRICFRSPASRPRKSGGGLWGERIRGIVSASPFSLSPKRQRGRAYAPTLAKSMTLAWDRS